MNRKYIAMLVIALMLGTAGCSGQKAPAETPAATEASTEAAVVETSTEAPAETEESMEAQPVSGDTLGLKYSDTFCNSSAQDASSAVDELIEAGHFDTEMVKMEVTPGFLDGFTGDITAFTTGYKFSPMIGSIPFVGYVFETEDSEGLTNALMDLADPAWNICTEADETRIESRGNLVFFLMCSNEE